MKDFFGVPPGDRIPDVGAKPEYTNTAPEPTIEGAMQLESLRLHDEERRGGQRRTRATRTFRHTAFNERAKAATQIDKTRVFGRKSPGRNTGHFSRHEGRRTRRNKLPLPSARWKSSNEPGIKIAKLNSIPLDGECDLILGGN